MACRVVPLNPADYSEITELWEASVKASHHFLKDDEIDFYKPYILKYALPECLLYGIKETNGRISAFIGLSVDKIEMLFVHPAYFRHGYGKKLIFFAESRFKICKVDVNEENPKALDFYRHLGFKIISSSELDGNSKPHPILFLQK